MKHIPISILLLLLMQSCMINWGDPEQEPFDSYYQPVKYARKDLDTTIKLLDPQPTLQSGKIYTYQHFLFVGERRKGFHIYNNADPANPLKTGFIQILGCSDVSIRNDVMYFNQATDLVAVAYYPNEDSVSLEKRVPNVFPNIMPENGWGVWTSTDKDSVIIDWIIPEQP